MDSLTNEEGDKIDFMSCHKPFFGRVCLARAKDGNWYRAVSLGQAYDEQLSVYFADYGFPVSYNLESSLSKIFKPLFKCRRL